MKRAICRYIKYTFWAAVSSPCWLHALLDNHWKAYNCPSPFQCDDICFEWNTNPFLIVTGCLFPEIWAIIRSRRFEKARLMELQEFRSWFWQRINWNQCMDECLEASRGWRHCECKDLSFLLYLEWERSSSAMLAKISVTRQQARTQCLVSVWRTCSKLLSKVLSRWEIDVLSVEENGFSKVSGATWWWTCHQPNLGAFNHLILTLFPIETRHVGMYLLAVNSSTHNPLHPNWNCWSA